jgi:hypothetical protein
VKESYDSQDSWTVCAGIRTPNGNLIFGLLCYGLRRMHPQRARRFLGRMTALRKLRRLLIAAEHAEREVASQTSGMGEMNPEHRIRFKEARDDEAPGVDGLKPDVASHPRHEKVLEFSANLVDYNEALGSYTALTGIHQAALSAYCGGKL